MLVFNFDQLETTLNALDPDAHQDSPGLAACLLWARKSADNPPFLNGVVSFQYLFMGKAYSHLFILLQTILSRSILIFI